MRQTALIVLILMLSACGGNAITPPPTATPDITTQVPTSQVDALNPFGVTQAIPTVEGTPIDLFATLTARGEANVPDPNASVATFVPYGGIEVSETPPPIGVASYSSVTEDPNIGLIFDQVILVRQGGLNATIDEVRLQSDGTLTWNGIPQPPVDRTTVEAVDATLDEINIFGLVGQFKRFITEPYDYVYTLQVSRAGAELSFMTDSSLTPPELFRLYDQLLGLVGMG